MHIWVCTQCNKTFLTANNFMKCTTKNIKRNYNKNRDFKGAKCMEIVVFYLFTKHFD